MLGVWLPPYVESDSQRNHAHCYKYMFSLWLQDAEIEEKSTALCNNITWKCQLHKKLWILFGLTRQRIIAVVAYCDWSRIFQFRDANILILNWSKKYVSRIFQDKWLPRFYVTYQEGFCSQKRTRLIFGFFCFAVFPEKWSSISHL